MEKSELNQSKSAILLDKAKIILSEALGLAVLGLAAIFAEEVKSSCLTMLKEKLNSATRSDGNKEADI